MKNAHTSSKIRSYLLAQSGALILLNLFLSLTLSLSPIPANAGSTCEQKCGIYPGTLGADHWKTCCRRVMGATGKSKSSGTSNEQGINEQEVEAWFQAHKNFKPTANSSYAPDCQVCGEIPTDAKEQRLWGSCCSKHAHAVTKTKPVDCNRPAGADQVEYCERQMQLRNSSSSQGGADSAQ